MTRWTSITATALALVVVLRWVLSRHDSLGRARRFPWASVVLLVVLALGTATLQLRHEGLERRLSRVAGRLDGVGVTVRCQSLGKEMVDVGSELGYVRWGPDGVPEHSTLIKREQCADLASYLASPHGTPTPGQVIAVHVLTHEAMHMAGLTGEAQAECAAVQRDADTARRLGASPVEAQALAVEYWTTTYPRMPEDYRTADCAPGGPLDEGGPDAPWLPAGLGSS